MHKQQLNKKEEQRLSHIPPQNPATITNLVDAAKDGMLTDVKRLISQAGVPYYYQTYYLTALHAAVVYNRMDCF